RAHRVSCVSARNFGGHVMEAVGIRSNLRYVVAMLCACATCGGAAAATVYVNANANGANDGSSWTNAFTNLQTAVAAAQSGDELWVAAATYRPAPAGGSQAIAFDLRSGVAIYGGFAGTETDRDQRNFATQITTLSGILGQPAGNSFHVVRAISV